MAQFYDPRTGKAITTEQAIALIPHVDAPWCRCARCSDHAEYIHTLAARIDAAQARLA